MTKKTAILSVKAAYVELITDKKRAKEVKEMVKKLKKFSQICLLCGMPIIIEEDHTYFHEGKPVHRSCWMDAVGNEIEQHPLGYVPSRFR